MNPIRDLIAQLIRHFLSIAVGFLFAYGVAPETGNAAVEAIINWVVPIAVAIAVN